MRGKPGQAGDAGSVCGLIPAYAGKTISSLNISIMKRAHPRVCGENINLVGGSGALAGSSPRMRGKLKDFAVNVWQNRLIPAYAGKTGSTGFGLLPP